MNQIKTKETVKKELEDKLATYQKQIQEKINHHLADAVLYGEGVIPISDIDRYKPVFDNVLTWLTEGGWTVSVEKREVVVGSYMNETYEKQDCLIIK
ncbi:hypothetical protein H6775_03660 [Candidatus Nomurabacteria bacterium]|nr:hypothetical protein [Candidatus Nomurabacteria bacterium]